MGMGSNGTGVDKAALAESAEIAGQSLRGMESGIQMNGLQSDMMQLGGQAAKLGIEAGKEGMKLTGQAITAVFSIFSLGDRNADGIPDDQQNLDEIAVAAPRPAPSQFGMPSPG
jgi:hypothetical protein